MRSSATFSQITTLLSIAVVLSLFAGCAEFEEEIPILAENPQLETISEKLRDCTPAQWEEAIQGIGSEECLPETDVKAPNGIASLQMINEEGQWSHRCGAALNKNQWLVTAAHCVFGMPQELFNQNQLRVCVGQSDLRKCGPQNVAFVGQYTTHPKYRDRSHVDAGSDIAVLKLKRAIPGARPMRMARKAPKRGQTTTIYGWGDMSAGDLDVFSPLLQSLDRKVIATNRCKRIYKQTDNTKIVGKNITCTQATLQFGACHGDSGGPLMKGGQLVGLVSGGDPTCSGATPDLFVSLKQTRKWINRQTR